MDDIDALIAQHSGQSTATAPEDTGDDIDALIALHSGQVPEQTPQTTLGTDIGQAIGGGIKYVVEDVPRLLNPSNAVRMAAHPVQSAIGEAKGIGQVGVTLANMVTTPGRALSSGIPAALGTMAGGGGFNQGYQAFKQEMGRSAIPQPQAFQPTNPQQELGAQYGSAAANLATMALPAKAGVQAGLKGTARILPEQVGDIMQSAGNRIGNTRIKINSPEAKMGAKTEYFGKYDLIRKPAEAKEYALAQIRETAKELKTEINSVKFDPADVNTRENIVQLLNRVEEKMVKENKYNPNDMTRAFAPIKANLAKGLRLDFKHAPSLKNNIDLADAQALKQYIGKNGDWLEINGQRSGNLDANNSALVHNAIYDELKTALENKGGPRVKELNKKLSELIPMDRAISKRLLVASRNNPIPIQNYLGGLAIAGHVVSGGSLLPATVVAAEMASRSPTIGRMFYNAGTAIKNAKKNKTIANMTER